MLLSSDKFTSSWVRIITLQLRFPSALPHNHLLQCSHGESIFWMIDI